MRNGHLLIYKHISWETNEQKWEVEGIISRFSIKFQYFDLPSYFIMTDREILNFVQKKFEIKEY